MRYEIVPITLKKAREFQDANHRHNMGAKAHKFSIGLEKDGELVGCATVGRPVARMMDDGMTAEILRVCVLPETKNGNTMLYAACVRAAKAMGYKKVITYTLQTESGSSLRGGGFKVDAMVKQNPCCWNTEKRPRKTKEQEKYPEEDKIRWVHY